MISTVLAETREALDRDAIVVTSSGNVQAQMLQEMPFYVPRTCISSGGFSTMGFTVPAALGAKLAMPERQVLGLIGDGDFLMSMQELATAVQLKLPVVYLVANNKAWMSIKDLQMAAFGDNCAYATEFVRDGEPYSPDFTAAARAFGCHAERVERAGEVAPALRRAFESGETAVVEVMTHREFPYSGSPAEGWWDVPTPAYLAAPHALYVSGRKEERLG
jgi:acetolactate synthase I/II/III large subunit